MSLETATPRRWAVLIGINGYHESLKALDYCNNDVMLMHETLTSECCGFAPENVILLTDDQPKDRVPTYGNIHSWLGTWLTRPGPDDLVLVYFAGHGRTANSEAILAPIDATLESLPVTGIAVSYITGLLARCPAAQKVLLLDACHSGAGRDVATMSSSFRTAIDSGKGIYTIASCDADQISYEWPDKKQGVFTHYLAEALRHRAPVGIDGRVTLDAVYENTREGILAWTSDKRLKQEPVRICRTKGDIHIAMRSLSVEQQLDAARGHIREQEETIRRLRVEVEKLTGKNKALEEKNKSLADTVAIKRAAPAKRVTVKEWKEWVGKRGPYSEFKDDILCIPAILTCVTLLGGLVGAVVIGSCLLSGLLKAPTAACWLGAVLAGLALGPGIAFLIWLQIFRVWQNKYHLYCSEECMSGDDYVAGAAYALAMGRAGVDQGRGGAVVVQLADLAAAKGDGETAKLLYGCGHKTWKEPYCERALQAIEDLACNEDQP